MIYFIKFKSERYQINGDSFIEHPRNHEVRKNAEKVLQRGIGIECNPSSNVLIGTFKRYERHPILQFNKPFNCIKMEFGNFSDILNSARFCWEGIKNIIWLDYDGGIKSRQFQDVETCISKADTGSIIFISFNSDLGDDFISGSSNERLEFYRSRIDNESAFLMQHK